MKAFSVASDTQCEKFSSLFLTLSHLNGKKTFLIAATDNFYLVILLSTFYHSLWSLTLHCIVPTRLTQPRKKNSVFTISHQQFLLSHYIFRLCRRCWTLFYRHIIVFSLLHTIDVFQQLTKKAYLLVVHIQHEPRSLSFALS